MNMGGPFDQDEVQPFLSRLFQDHDLIPLPFQDRLGPLLAFRRTPKIKDQYNQIGGGSPIRQWTDRQGKLLTELLDQLSPETGNLFLLLFHYFIGLFWNQTQDDDMNSQESKINPHSSQNYHYPFKHKTKQLLTNITLPSDTQLL
jgi:protoheme ferro-lyase